MATTYYFCDGNTRTSTDITMTELNLPPRQWQTANGTVITVEEKRLTFTASVIPLGNIRIFYTYETRNRIDPNQFTDNWYTVTTFVTLQAGQSSVSVDVPLSRTDCFNDGETVNVGGYDEGW